MQVFPEVPLHVTSLALRSQRDHQVREGPLVSQLMPSKRLQKKKERQEQLRNLIKLRKFRKPCE